MPREDYGGWMRAFREDATGVEHSFDVVAKGLAENSISRRQALKLAGASLLGSALGAAGLLRFAAPAEADAFCPIIVSAGCSLWCKSTEPHLPAEDCMCIKTVSGSRECVRPCCSWYLCSLNIHCRSNEVCMRSPCCNNGQPTCVRKCGQPPAPETTTCWA